MVQSPLPSLLLCSIFWLCLTLHASAQADSAWAYLPPATFWMGDSLHDADERPVHPVQVAALWMGRREVTVAEFGAFVQASGYRTQAERGNGSMAWDSLGWSQQPQAHWRCDEAGRPLPASAYQRPVTHVTWIDAAHYCNWLSQRERRTPVYTLSADTLRANLAADGYRLPTEAEWEYAAAGGFSRKKHPYAGSDDLGKLAWFSNNSARHPHVVGQKLPNEAGLYDLCGNVWEWCHDLYSPQSYTAGGRAAVISGPPSGGLRSLRGGSFSNNPSHCRISNRSSRYPDYCDANTGFRVVRAR
ncbi:MAG TPA: formylglycine-generating enzyme family protein [Saprospiraceae bacterium]|nr:formylglycine-generating enzyme family protein [Saprospiraceae bacterium]HND87295.1 formylglycine-generating enzyme family protein [Saprospiraceae bacterium]HNG89371.1 formylglycine-generating enzyme family protein [Saprospiraceae bacterium]